MNLYQHQLTEMKETLDTWLTETQTELTKVTDQIDDLDSQRSTLESRKYDLDEALSRIECMIEDVELLNDHLFGGS